MFLWVDLTGFGVDWERSHSLRILIVMEWLLTLVMVKDGQPSKLLRLDAFIIHVAVDRN